jgi:hypothetical protein
MQTTNFKISYLIFSIEAEVHFILSSMSLQAFVGPARSISFVILYTADRTSWTGNQSHAKPLPTHRTTQTQNKHADIHASSGMKLITPVFERTKTIQASDKAATVVGETEAHPFHN